MAINSGRISEEVRKIIKGASGDIWDMRHSRRELLIAAVGTSLLAGCLGDDADDDADPPDDGDGTDDDPNGDDEEEPGDENGMEDDGEGGNGTGTTVDVRDTDEFGTILVGPDDLTLYMFDADEQGAGESTCYEDCATNWPPLVVEDEPVAGEGVEAELSTFERDDGEVQVAADGWPLYYWIADEEPGDVDGQGVNDVWWVLGPSGAPIRDDEDGDADHEDDDSSSGPGY